MPHGVVEPPHPHPHEQHPLSPRFSSTPNQRAQNGVSTLLPLMMSLAGGQRPQVKQNNSHLAVPSVNDVSVRPAHILQGLSIPQQSPQGADSCQGFSDTPFLGTCPEPGHLIQCTVASCLHKKPASMAS